MVRASEKKEKKKEKYHVGHWTTGLGVGGGVWVSGGCKFRGGGGSGDRIDTTEARNGVGRYIIRVYIILYARHRQK